MHINVDVVCTEFRDIHEGLNILDSVVCNNMIMFVYIDVLN